MIPAGLAHDVVVVVEPAMVEDRGAMVPDWTKPPASRIRVCGCSVQPGVSSEDADGRQQVETRWLVWAPPGAPITAHSAVEWRGVLHQVDGDPKRWTDPSGILSHVAFEMVSWRG